MVDVTPPSHVHAASSLLTSGSRSIADHHVVDILGHKFVMDVPIHALILSAIGALFVLVKLVRYLVFLSQTLLFRGIPLSRFGAGKPDVWAVITGPTSGIGEAFARQLAARKLNLVLVGRRKAALEQLGEEIERKHPGVKTQSVELDLATAANDAAAEAGWKRLEGVVQGLDVGVLVNNAGVSHDMPVPFAEGSDEEMERILQVNISSVLRITKLVLPGMVSRRRGLVLNLGSFAAVVPSPFLSTYSGSKSFLSTWSKCLAEEVRPRGITVSCVIPYFVSTKMSKIRKTSALVPSPDAFVRSTLASIGLSKGALGRPGESTPYWSHAFLDYAITALGLGNWAIGYNRDLQLSIRKRALKKKERQAKAQ